MILIQTAFQPLKLNSEGESDMEDYKTEALKELNSEHRKTKESLAAARKKDRSSYYTFDMTDEQFEKWEHRCILHIKSINYLKRLVRKDMKKNEGKEVK